MNIVIQRVGTVFSRIEDILHEKRIKPADFQRRMEINSQMWNNWKIRGVPAKRYEQICKVLGLNLNWLITGLGAKYELKTKSTIDSMDSRIARIAKYAQEVIDDSRQEFTEEQIKRIFKSALAVGIDYELSDELVTQYVKDLIGKLAITKQ